VKKHKLLLMSGLMRGQVDAKRKAQAAETAKGLGQWLMVKIKWLRTL
jgi:hypothetical protein